MSFHTRNDTMLALMPLGAGRRGACGVRVRACVMCFHWTCRPECPRDGCKTDVYLLSWWAGRGGGADGKTLQWRCNEPVDHAHAWATGMGGCCPLPVWTWTAPPPPPSPAPCTVPIGGGASPAPKIHGAKAPKKVFLFQMELSWKVHVAVLVHAPLTGGGCSSWGLGGRHLGQGDCALGGLLGLGLVFPFQTGP